MRSTQTGANEREHEAVKLPYCVPNTSVKCSGASMFMATPHGSSSVDGLVRPASSSWPSEFDGGDGVWSRALNNLPYHERPRANRVRCPWLASLSVLAASTPSWCCGFDDDPSTTTMLRRATIREPSKANCVIAGELVRTPGSTSTAPCKSRHNKMAWPREEPV